MVNANCADYYENEYYVTAYDMLGRQMISQTVSAGPSKLERGTLSSDMHFFTISSGTSVISKCNFIIAE
jgi:hypothetical protein